MEWRKIHGYKKYEINENGIIRRTWDGKAVPWSYCTNGYPQVTINSDSMKYSTRLVHVLVASAFIRPLCPGEEINHKDKKRHNPRLTNLEIMPSKKDHMKKHRTGWHPCPGCGIDISKHRGHCSEECRHKQCWEKRICKVCSKPFEIRKAYVRRSAKDPRYKRLSGVYCSNPCRLSDIKNRTFSEDYLKNVRVLSSTQVEEIRSLFVLIKNNSEIARMYGVSRSTISALRKGKTYKSLNLPQDRPSDIPSLDAGRIDGEAQIYGDRGQTATGLF